MNRRLLSYARPLAALALAVVVALAAGPRAASAAELAEYLDVLKRGDAARLAAMLRADRGRTPRGVRGASLLHLACSYHHASGQPALVAALLAAGADPAARDDGGRTPLQWAAGYGCRDCVTLLLKAGADPNARAANGRTPLFSAADEIVPMLIAAGADSLARDADDNVPLHFRPIAALLGPGVNVRNRAGLTPLHRAALDGDEKALRWLLEQGADASLATAGTFEHREGVLAPEFDPVHRFEPGLRAYDLAKWQHDRTKWSTGRFRSIVERLDAVTPRRSLLRR